jgi:hypothetical protein
MYYAPLGKSGSERPLSDAFSEWLDHTTSAIPPTPKGESVITDPLRYGALQAKFAASLVLPVPLYVATCGYGHSGRVMVTRLFST